MNFITKLLVLLCPQYRTNAIKFHPEELECRKFWVWYCASKHEGKIKGIASHFPNEIANNKSPLFGMKLSLIGRVRGMPDYLFIKSDKGLGIEFKVGKNKLTPNQVIVKEWFEVEGIPYYEVRSMEEAIQAMKNEGFLID